MSENVTRLPVAGGQSGTSAVCMYHKRVSTSSYTLNDVFLLHVFLAEFVLQYVIHPVSKQLAIHQQVFVCSLSNYSHALSSPLAY